MFAKFSFAFSGSGLCACCINLIVSRLCKPHEMVLKINVSCL